MRNYDPDYQWLPANHNVSETLARAATATLKRIPIEDLTALQAANVKIDSKYCGLFKIGEAQHEVRGGEAMVVVYVTSEMSGFSESAMAGVLVHELAHARLGHCTKLALKSTNESERIVLEGRAEAEANRLAKSWGFGKELRLADEYLKGQRRIIIENADRFLKV